MSNKTLPTLPELKYGIKYPPFEIEEQMEKVKRTNPSEYLSEIRNLLKQIEKYRECLEYQGYTVKDLGDPNKVHARKEEIVY
jgi:DNA-binding protein H-NS